MQDYRRLCRFCSSPCLSRNSKVYCSRACSFAMTNRLAQQRQALRKKPCLRCGALPAGDNRGRVRATAYCSWACLRLSQQERATKRRERHPKQCPGCGVSFVPRQCAGRSWTKFCSKQCGAAFRRKHKFTETPCTVCGAVCRKVVSQIKRSRKIACSPECLKAVNKGALSPMFRPASIQDPKRRRSTGRWKRASQQARNRDGHSCRRCRRQRDPNERQFPVDHIIPWRVFADKAEADDISNLATLCPECHSWKTNTVELKYLKGDVLGMNQYRHAISLP